MPIEDGEDNTVRSDGLPHTYLRSGSWPDGKLAEDAPIGAHAAREVSRRLVAAMAARGLSQRALAETAGVSHMTVGRVLAGAVYCDLATLARLEQATGTELYPALGELRPARPHRRSPGP